MIIVPAGFSSTRIGAATSRTRSPRYVVSCRAPPPVPLRPPPPARGEPFRQRVPDEGVGEDREDGRHRDDVQGERQHETNRQAVPLHLESRHCAVSPPKPRTAPSPPPPGDGGF